LDEVRVYQRAFSLSEIQALYSYALGPQVYIPFEEKQGATAADVTGGGHNASVTYKWTNGKYGGGIMGDNAGKGATISNNLTFGYGSFTLSTWIKTADIDSAQSRIMGEDFTSGGWYWVNVDTNG